MSTSNQTYKELAIPYFKESFDCIDEVMQELQIPYYLIGVSAIDLERIVESAVIASEAISSGIA
ncbi:MAG: hypothetical protein KKA07_08625 [Bacteroidetes bacterium]|nr:hypothetical protein [Bacteroidota bacterium]MBU1719126.1 hypothetical protein [Bacteroidota bacterium]